VLRLKIRNLRVTLGNNSVIRSADLELKEGESILISGPSGSGKTTLLRVISGIIPTVFNGKVEGRIEPELSLRKALISYLPQEPWFGIATPYVWSEVSSFTSFKDSASVRDLLKIYGMENLIMRTTFTLSAGESQRLAIAVANGMNSKLVLLDEPTSHLDRRNSLKVRSSVKSLKDEGKSIIVVDHNFSFWNGIVDKAYLMLNGKLVEYNSSVYAKALRVLSELRPPSGYSQEVLRAHVSSYRYPGTNKPILKDIHIVLNRGEILAVLGPSGAGKTTLLKAIISSLILKRRDVKVISEGKVLYIPDNPLLYYSSPTLRKEVGPEGIKYLEAFNLLEVLDLPIGRLSSGERRRGAIASALSRGAAVILMDEPTVGLDPLSKVEVMKALVEAAQRGVGFIIATHDLDLLKISNRVIRL